MALKSLVCLLVFALLASRADDLEAAATPDPYDDVLAAQDNEYLPVATDHRLKVGAWAFGSATTCRLVTGFEQGFHFGPQRFVPRAYLLQILLTLVGGTQLQGLQEQVIRLGVPGCHGSCPIGSRLPSSISARNRGSLRAKK